jgi:cyanophycin synthetase
VTSIRAFCATSELNYSTQLIRKAALARDIKFKLLAQYQHHVEHELYSLTSPQRTHIMDITRPDASSATAFSITKNKYVTQLYLKQHKLPHTDAQCFDDMKVALHHFKEMEGSCVVKPVVGGGSMGITLHVSDEQACMMAIEKALQHYPIYMLERYIEYPDYRLLFVNAKCIAISQRLPAFVEGDGEQDIKALVATTNADRAVGRTGPLSKIIINEDVIAYLSAHNIGMGYVPKAKERVFLRSQTCMDLGGVGLNVDVKLHPKNHEALSALCQSLGLQVAAIDVVSNDLSLAFGNAKSKTAILEVLSRPRLRLHECPLLGTPIAASEAILDMLFPETVHLSCAPKHLYA